MSKLCSHACNDLFVDIISMLIFQTVVAVLITVTRTHAAPTSAAGWSVQILVNIIINPAPAKLIYLSFHPLEVVSSYRDPQHEVAENH